MSTELDTDRGTDTASRDWILGIDVGGTFTDIIGLNARTREVRDSKVLTIPGQEDGVLASIAAIDVAPHEVLDSYVNGEHEQRAAEIVAEELPGAYIQTSALYPITKEHERTVTVALDAYVGPLVVGYLDRLNDRLLEQGFAGTIWIMMMNGGVATLRTAGHALVFQLVSGPVGGVSGSVKLAVEGSSRNRTDVARYPVANFIGPRMVVKCQDCFQHLSIAAPLPEDNWPAWRSPTRDWRPSRAG